ncbi:MAG TPA: hypothetical protein PK995_03115 [Bacteroidia bacterium]|nr:hypothetical protein [Bacteroidia bacterium]
MTKFLSNFLFGLSVITHPVFLPLYLMIWYFYFPLPVEPTIYSFFIASDLKLKWLLLYGLLTVAVPLVILFISKIFSVVNSILLDSVKDRRYFFLLLGIYYWFVFYMFRNVYAHNFFKPSILLVAVTSFIMLLSSLLTNNTFKLSIHSAGMGAVTGFFASLILIFKSDFLEYVFISVMISSLIMALRMIVRAHNFLEVLSGWAIGVFSCVIVFLAGYKNG